MTNGTLPVIGWEDFEVGGDSSLTILHHHLLLLTQFGDYASALAHELIRGAVVHPDLPPETDDPRPPLIRGYHPNSNRYLAGYQITGEEGIPRRKVRLSLLPLVLSPPSSQSSHRHIALLG